ASEWQAWRSSHPRCGSAASYAAVVASAAGSCPQGGSQYRRGLRCHTCSPGRTRDASHPGRSPTGQAIWQCGCGRCLRGGAGTAGPRVPLRAPLSGAQSTGSSHSTAGRSTHPRTQPVSRPDPATHQLRGTQSMNLIELNRSLVQLRLSGMAAVLETRLLQAQSEAMAPIDLISILVSDELACRSKRLLERRHKQAQFRDPNKQLDNFDF